MAVRSNVRRLCIFSLEPIARARTKTVRTIRRRHALTFERFTIPREMRCTSRLRLHATQHSVCPVYVGGGPNSGWLRARCEGMKGIVSIGGIANPVCVIYGLRVLVLVHRSSGCHTVTWTATVSVRGIMHTGLFITFDGRCAADRTFYHQYTHLPGTGFGRLPVGLLPCNHLPASWRESLKVRCLIGGLVVHVAQALWTCQYTYTDRLLTIEDIQRLDWVGAFWFQSFPGYGWT